MNTTAFKDRGNESVAPGAVQTKRRGRRGFGFGIFMVQVGVITLVAVVAAGIAVIAQSAQVQEEAQRDVDVLAHSVASLPLVIDALQSADPTTQIQPLTTAMQQAAGAEYISVVDTQGIRVAHPRPDLVGKPVSSDHSEVLGGEEFYGSEEGPMGVTLRAKVPVIAPSGDIVGTVSVGILVSQVQEKVAWRALQISLPTLAAVLVGLFISWRVTAGLRRRLYGAEPEDMLALVQSRQAMTDGVQDGFIGVDENGRIALVNRGASRLLNVPDGLVGMRARDVLPNEVSAFLEENAAPATQQLLAGGRTLVVTRSSAVADGRSVGTMLVLQDRSELESMLENIKDERARSTVLRIEAHDFDNRMHVISGLLSVGDVEDAREYLDTLPKAAMLGMSKEWEQIQSPFVAALLSSRQLNARGEGIEISLTEDSRVDDDFVCGSGELTTIGNLLSNAIEAAHSRIEVFIRGDRDGLEIIVDDDGPGVSETEIERIFVQGETSKSVDAWRHGIGLDVIRTHVTERGGEIAVSAADLGGARFQVSVPAAEATFGTERP